MRTSPTRRVTADGLGQTLAVNALSPFLLTALRLPVLERSDSARAVTVSSRPHLPGSRGRPADFDDPHLQHGYHPDRAYQNSKLVAMRLTYELPRRLGPQDIIVNAVCPGLVPDRPAAGQSPPRAGQP
jgi:retinol dehydrogenase-12